PTPALVVAIGNLEGQTLQPLETESPSTVPDIIHGTTSRWTPYFPSSANLRQDHRDRYCYYFSGTNRLQRVHAQSYCKTLHPYGRLVEIETGEELVSLTLYLNDQDEQRKCGTWGAHYWIGAEWFASPAFYKWISTGKPLTYSNWVPGYPRADIQHAVVLANEYNYKWMNYRKQVAFKFICEWDGYKF
ncbi:unnamed protein product, partial [Cyprideis torosa]